MSFEVMGRMHKKYDTENKSETFRAREFVLEINTEGNYPQFVKFQMVQDRCAVIDPFNEGDLIKVHFDLRGREWNGKYLTNLNAWKVEKLEAAATSGNPVAPSAGYFPSADDEPASSGDDLPF